MCCGNSPQGIFSLTVTASHVTQGRAGYESTLPRGTVEGLDLWYPIYNNNNNNHSNLPALQSMMCHVLSYLCSPLFPIQRIWPPVSKAHHLHIFLSPCSYRVVVQLLEAFRHLRILRYRILNPTPNLQPGGPGYPFLSETSSLTYATWKALPVAALRPTWLSVSFDDASPTTVLKKRYIRRELPNMWLPPVQN